ncbi:NAD(+) kinase [Lachnospiraceae bacterium WCA-9-b2]|uniref:NAD kinase n=2 Tax=Sporofaciens musculi TaxID=2681861 RepID=A0A7X3SJA2_9FIRM|nr:NAD(+)/NADH kinase [Sporofaciens musculi]MCI9423311.1 NAD(+)/NADH kinase [Dorea sp.]MXP76165.1 NAD(+) kinase [Sporofaciens musculi]
MDRFLIVTNDGKDTKQTVTSEVKELLEAAGKVCILCRKDENKKIIKSSVPNEVDCAIVIGGDGSLIEVARLFWEKDIPILGVNMGTLGYLTEVEVGGIDGAVNQLISGDYVLERRMMLEGIFEDGRSDVSLNDIVVSRKGELHIIHFRLYVNGELLNDYEADGVVLSTPTGSTAYNLSAGGPIVEPTASLIVITPICSHALNTRSIVLSAEDEIVIEIGPGRNGSKEEVYVAFDGADAVSLKTGDKVMVRRSNASTTMIKLSKVSFLETLRGKMKGN